LGDFGIAKVLNSDTEFAKTVSNSSLCLRNVLVNIALLV
jgi:serine/threonine protein kinase